MGLLEWFTRSATKELDRRVGGVEGEAHGRYAGLVDEAELRVRARIGNGHRGTVTVSVLEVRQEAEAAVAVDLGPGKRYRDEELTVFARVIAAGDALAALTVEVTQPDPARPEGPPLGFETYSVESRFDANREARLRLVVRLG
jgi:hypothetical protein